MIVDYIEVESINFGVRLVFVWILVSLFMSDVIWVSDVIILNFCFFMGNGNNVISFKIYWDIYYIWFLFLVMLRGRVSKCKIGG